MRPGFGILAVDKRGHIQHYSLFSSVQLLSRVRLLVTPWTAACQASLSYQLLELAQTHVHWVGDAIQPSHPLLSPSPPAFNLLQHQDLLQCQLFASGGQRIGASASASFLPTNIQDWFPLGLTGLISLQSKGLSRVFPTPQFKGINSLALSLFCCPALTSVRDYWKIHSFD